MVGTNVTVRVRVVISTRIRVKGIRFRVRGRPS